jgi:hypothetical protein
MLLSCTGLEITQASEGNIDNSSVENISLCNSGCVNTIHNNKTRNYSNLNSYMRRLYEVTIIRLHLSALYEKENRISVDVHSTNK